MFKRPKQPFRDPAENTAGSNGLGALDAASTTFAELIVKRLQDERGVHAETAITAAGSIAGNCLLRATRHDLHGLTPGSAVFTEEVNEAGPKIIDVMSDACSIQGIDPRTGWNLQPPAENNSLRSGIELTRLLRSDFESMLPAYGIGQRIEPLVAAVAAIKLVKMASGTLDPEIGKAIAIRAVVAGSKTVPFPD
ncbi:MAG: hypothetical protein EBS05_20725 [Proteobacteria bacterium]|nr:hypothetical protein [Pseudomonadota bacterium]